MPVRGLKLAKNVPKIANVSIFCHFRSLRGIKTLQKYFRNEYLTFTSENEVGLDDLLILKIGFKNGLEIGLGNVLGKPWEIAEVMLWEMVWEIVWNLIGKWFGKYFRKWFGNALGTNTQNLNNLPRNSKMLT